ncbi:hypothetical protein CAPN006_12660 [Capnocytophaga canimorsus]|nr:hypothetical protein CAPN006_12660 [Capnocytophaga canimorsus]
MGTPNANTQVAPKGAIRKGDFVKCVSNATVAIAIAPPIPEYTEKLRVERLGLRSSMALNDDLATNFYLKSTPLATGLKRKM